MNLANHFSVSRILLVPLFVISLMYYSPERHWLHDLSISVFILACVTDGVDGYLARTLKQKTVLGSYLDPVADKLLLLSGFLSLSLMGHLPVSMRIPAWVAIPVIARDVIILIGSIMVYLTTGKLKAEPLFIGKVTTVFQMLTLFIALLSSPEDIRLLFFIMTVALTILSGMGYVRMGGRLLR